MLGCEKLPRPTETRRDFNSLSALFTFMNLLPEPSIFSPANVPELPLTETKYCLSNNAHGTRREQGDDQ